MYMFQFYLLTKTQGAKTAEANWQPNNNDMNMEKVSLRPWKSMSNGIKGLHTSFLEDNGILWVPKSASLINCYVFTFIFSWEEQDLSSLQNVYMLQQFLCSLNLLKLIINFTKDIEEELLLKSIDSVVNLTVNAQQWKDVTHVKQQVDESGRFVDHRVLTRNSASRSRTVFLS